MSTSSHITSPPAVNQTQPASANKSATVGTVIPLKAVWTMPSDASLELKFADSLGLGLGLTPGKWTAESGGDSSVVYRWDDHKSFWRAMDNGQKGSEKLAAVALDWLTAVCAAKGSEALAKSCAATARLWLEQKYPLPEFDRSRVLVPCQDAYLEIDPTGLITACQPHSDDGLTYAVPVDTNATWGSLYTPQPLPKNSKFAKFLSLALPDLEVQTFVQEQCGATLLPACYRRAAWWYGRGQNGKGVLAKLIERFHSQVVALKLEKLGDDFGLTGIIGASLIRVDEKENKAWDEGIFKSLVSSDSVLINRKNRDPLTYCSHAKWLITTNPAPKYRDGSDGVADRIEAVEWTVQVPQKDQVPDYDRVIFESEANIVLDWLLAGAARVVLRGRARTRAEMPEAVKATFKEVRAKSDSVRAWVDAEKAQTTETAWREKSAVYDAYAAWCISTQIAKHIDAPIFWRAMKDIFPELHEKKAGTTGDRKRLVNIINNTGEE